VRLHWFWSTNPQKVRLALEELGEPYELVVVDCAFAPWLPHLDHQDFTQLSAWIERIKARESWDACQMRY